MGSINTPRVLLGGLLAGFVMNVGEAALHAGLLGDDTSRLYADLHVPLPSPSANIPILVGVTFLMGIVSVWMYAAIRPRFGAGAKTALIAGIAVWALMHLWSGVYLANGYAGVFTTKLAWLPVAWGLVEALLATVVGAAVYKEK